MTPQAVPTHESLMAIKHKKKLFSTGTDQFNVKPTKGISYLQESRLLSNPVDPFEVAHWLRENPHLDKNMIGEYISNKKNLEILKAFVKSFDFSGMRIDEALRMFLQTFRLPGDLKKNIFLFCSKSAFLFHSFQIIGKLVLYNYFNRYFYDNSLNKQF